MHTIETIRSIFRDKLKREEFVTDKSGVKTLEIVGAAFVADEPAVFGEPNYDYIKREIEWYGSQSLNVNDIPGEVPKIWKAVATPDGWINSNYGNLIFSGENGSQFAYAIQSLRECRDSRRAIMIYTRPSIQWEYNKDGMSDFICTNSVQLLIRNDQMHMVVNMRSNDCYHGFRNDFAWQSFILDKAIVAYNTADYKNKPVTRGEIHWQVGSFHVYEPHFKYVV